MKSGISANELNSDQQMAVKKELEQAGYDVWDQWMKGTAIPLPARMIADEAVRWATGWRKLIRPLRNIMRWVLRKPAQIVAQFLLIILQLLLVLLQIILALKK